MDHTRNRGAGFLAPGALVIMAWLAICGATPAHAGDNAGNTLVKVLGTFVLPDSELSRFGNGVIDVTDETVPTLSIAYFLTDNWALETICCFTEHSIYDEAGAFGAPGAKVASTWILPATLSLQYHQQMGAFKPYVGVGISYFNYFSETSEHLPEIRTVTEATI